MTGMDDAIDRAARVVDGILGADPHVAREMFGDEPDRIARALADAGLLAPVPLREEWVCRYVLRGGKIKYRGEGSEVDARSWATDDGDQIVHRFVSDWLPVDGAEGDGSEP